MKSLNSAKRREKILGLDPHAISRIFNKREKVKRKKKNIFLNLC